MLDWDGLRHPGDVTENGVATFNIMFHDCGKPVWFATSTFTMWSCHVMSLHLETIEDSNIFST